MIIDMAGQLSQIEKKISALSCQLADSPPGSLQISKSGKYYTYRQRSSDGTARYLSKNEMSLARSLAFKKYLQLQITELKARRKALIQFEEAMRHVEGQAARFLFENEGAGRLLRQHFPIENAPLAAWAAQPPAGSAPYQENRIFQCRSGHVVRSKSEGMIANALFAAQIPFRYEDPLRLGDVTLHPDFTIRHPVSGAYLYWEHFGRMDDPRYVKRMADALPLYISNGRMPGVDLIMTFESGDHPLTDAQIDHMLSYYF